MPSRPVEPRSSAADDTGPSTASVTATDPAEADATVDAGVGVGVGVGDNDLVRDRSWWPAVGFTALVVVAVGVALYAATRPTWLPTGDDAMLSVRSQDALRHPPLTGPYSRFGFDHPGPMFFYLQLPFIRLLGSSGALVTAAALAAASVVAAGWVAWRRGGFWLSALMATVLLVFVRSMGSTIVDPWNPWVAVLPFLACILAAWSLWCDDWWALPVLIGFGTLAAQTHISYAPFVGLLFLGAAGWMVATRRRRGPGGSAPIPTWLLVGSGLLLAVLWLPPLLDQIHGEPPNGTAIVQHFLGHDTTRPSGYFTSAEKPGPAQVAGTVALELGVPSPWIGAVEPTDPFTGELVPGSLLRLLPTLAVFVAAAVVGWRRRAVDALKLQALVAGLTVVGVPAVADITGGVFPYVVRWLWAFGALAWLSSLWTLAWCVLAGRPDPGHRVRIVAAAVPVVAFGWAVVALTGATPPGGDASAATAAMVDDVAASVSPSTPVMVVSDGVSSTYVRAGLVAELDRRGYDVVVPDDEAAHFGDGHTVAGRVIDTRLDVRAGTDLYQPPLDGDPRRIARFDPLTPDDRAFYDQTRLRIASEYAARMHGDRVADPVSDDDRRRFQALDAMAPAASVYLRQS